MLGDLGRGIKGHIAALVIAAMALVTPVATPAHHESHVPARAESSHSASVHHATKSSHRVAAKKARHHRAKRHHAKGHHHAKHHHAKRHHRAARHHKPKHHKVRHHRVRHHATSRDVARRAEHAVARALRPDIGAGRDVSWPQCPRGVGIRALPGMALPMPPAQSRFVVIGVTNGRSFTRNHCVASQLGWAKRHHAWATAYAMSTYPTRAQLRAYGDRGPFPHHGTLGRLKNAGYAQASFNISTMKRAGFATPHIWLDIEPSSARPWSRAVRNRAVVRGWVAAYRHAGYRVGFYSTAAVWRELLGRVRFGAAEWRTAGPASGRAALHMCHHEGFQGGRAVMVQWWSSRVDFDRMCPGFQGRSSMQRFFHKY